MADLSLAHGTLGALSAALDVLKRDDILVVAVHGLSMLVLARALVALLPVASVVDVRIPVAWVRLAAHERIQPVRFLVRLRRTLFH